MAVALGAIGVQLGNLGLHASNTWAVARDPKLLPALVGNSLLVSVVVGGAAALAAWAVLTVWPGIVGLSPGLLALGLVAIPIGLTYLLLQNLLLGTSRIRAFNSIELGVRIVTVAILAAVILAGAVNPFLAVLAGVVASTIGVFACLRALGARTGIKLSLSIGLLREHGRYGMKAYAAALFSFLVLRFDLLMVQYFAGPEQTGYYSIAVAMADLVYTVPVVVGMLLFPPPVRHDRRATEVVDRQPDGRSRGRGHGCGRSRRRVAG